MSMELPECTRHSRLRLVKTLWFAWVIALAPWAAPCLAEDASLIEHRLAKIARYLSSDELEGRGVGTKGLDVAADFIAQQFHDAGLKTEVYEGGPFQKFKMTTGATVGPRNELAFLGSPSAGKGQRIELKLGEDFNPLAVGGSGKFDLEVVFVGYGITAKDEHYDDYADVDVKDKAVIILRHQPQQSNPHGLFGGSKPSQHAPYKRKISNAYEHGAALVIFCTDGFDAQKNVAALRQRWQAAIDQIGEAKARFKAIEKPSAQKWKDYQGEIEALTTDVQKFAEQIKAAEDPLVPFEGAGADAADGRSFPVVYCRPSALDPVLRASLGKSLAQLEAEIDQGPAPHSQALAAWRVVGETSVERQEAEVKNIVGVLDGTGPHADETIVIGAHYDHLGFGGSNSAAPGVHEIHNGADDNGSGTTALLEVARQLASRAQKLPRRIVFVAFTGEERGLIGSARYVRDPLVPLESTVAMLNLDMVGRMEGDKLIIHGTGTAEEFESLVDRFAKQDDFQITKKPGGFGPSDHASFYAAKVPVLFFFTGSHKDYHRPSDDFEKLNVPGMRRVAQLVSEIAVTLAEAPDRPHYLEVKGGNETLGGGGDRPYFGSIPDFSQDQPGYALSGVTKGGPAERGGLKAGDVIVQFGDSKIGNLEDFDSALRKYKAGDKVKVVAKRGPDAVTLEVLLDPPR